MAIVRYTTEQLKKMESNTDWSRVLSMTDDDIDYSDAPDVADMIARGDARISRRVGRPRKEVTKQSINLRLDPDVIAGFKKTGRGWQSKINAALRGHLHSVGLL